VIGFMDPHKVIIRRNAFSTLPKEKNEREKKKLRKTWKKKKKKVTFILSHINHTFFNIEPLNLTPSL